MKPSFTQRHNAHRTPPVIADFPVSARNGLMYLLDSFVRNGCIKDDYDHKSWSCLYLEMLRTNRSPFTPVSKDVDYAECHGLLDSMRWDLVFSFVERVYSKLLVPKGYTDDAGDFVIQIPLDRVCADFAEETNYLLSEENMSFVFADGEFRRVGRPQTQKNLTTANLVLSEPDLHIVRGHFTKAQKFFFGKTPDHQNAVKEALCALEATLESKAGIKASKDFPKEVLKISGNEADDIPPPIVQMMIKLYSYRGGGEGVAHGTTQGLKVADHEAELVLSLVASLITYLVDHFNGLEPQPPF